MNNNTKTKTILFASLVAMLLIPAGVDNVAFADLSEDKLEKIAAQAAKLQNKINDGINVEKNTANLTILLDKLNDNGITMGDQSLDVLADWHSEGLDEVSTESNGASTECTCDHSMKIKAGYKYFKYHLFGINFYGHVTGIWSLDGEGGDIRDATVDVNNSHASSGAIWIYSVAGSSDRPTTATWDSTVYLVDNNASQQTPDHTTGAHTATFHYSWDSFTTPLSSGYFAGSNWDVIAEADIQSTV